MSVASNCSNEKEHYYGWTSDALLKLLEDVGSFGARCLRWCRHLATRKPTAEASSQAALLVRSQILPLMLPDLSFTLLGSAALYHRCALKSNNSCSSPANNTKSRHYHRVLIKMPGGLGTCKPHAWLPPTQAMHLAMAPSSDLLQI